MRSVSSSFSQTPTFELANNNDGSREIQGFSGLCCSLEFEYWPFRRRMVRHKQELLELFYGSVDNENV